jgi:hypothetical protein
LSLFFKSKQAFWYSFERLYELSLKVLLRLDTTATPNSKAFMMQKSKSYIRLGWDATNQKYTGKTEPVKMGSYSQLAFICISITRST